MRRMVQLNYDELRDIVHKFKDEGENIAQLHTSLRDRVRELHKDWQGEAADDFFAEMENELLPALSRLSKALFFTQDTLQSITKIIQDSDEDTKGFFKGDFTHFSPEHPGAPGANSWERINQYEVWDANRKEFVYPENWLQPEQAGEASSSTGRLMVANEITGEVSTVDLTTEGTTESVTPDSNDKTESNNDDGFTPKVTTVQVER